MLMRPHAGFAKLAAPPAAGARLAENHYLLTIDILQSALPRLLLVVLALAACWAVYRMRVRQIAARLRERIEERHRERERIARELHDTLLQAIQGLILRFQAIAERTPLSEPTRRLMDEALDRAQGALVEGRDRVNELRLSPGPAAGPLAQALEGVTAELGEACSARFVHIVVGAAMELDAVVRDEVYCIGREALINAARHADAHQIELRIGYEREGLRLQVRDDGCGIDAEVLRAGRRHRHWGLVGMRERAQKIGGQLRLTRLPERGTEVEVQVPARLAYVGWRAWFRRRLPTAF